MTRRRLLNIAYTPDSDDAFYYDALEAGRVALPEFQLRFHREPLSILNRVAMAGRYEVTAISSVLYPCISATYAILSVGASVGRGYGPVLVSRAPCAPEDLTGRRVGVGGIPTTGWFLLRWLCPRAEVVEMPFDEIAEAVAADEIAGGVMIHEELLHYPRLGLHRVADLGAAWCARHGLPLPVGLNVVRRDVGREAMQRICTALRASLQCARDNPQEALDRASRFGRGLVGGCTEQFVAMFANEDSLALPADARAGLAVLFAEVVQQGLAEAVPELDIVEGESVEPASQGVALGY